MRLPAEVNINYLFDSANTCWMDGTDPSIICSPHIYNNKRPGLLVYTCLNVTMVSQLLTGGLCPVSCGDSHRQLMTVVLQGHVCAPPFPGLRTKQNRCCDSRRLSSPLTLILYRMFNLDGCQAQQQQQQWQLGNYTPQQDAHGVCLNRVAHMITSSYEDQ